MRKALPHALLLLLLLASAASAQATSPPPICFAFNDPPAAPLPLPSAYMSYYGLFVAHFTAPSNSAVDRIDLWNGAGFCACGIQAVTITVYPTQSLGGAQSGAT